MFARDAAHSSFNPFESSLGRDNVARIQHAWRISLGAPLAAAPTLAEGVLYVGAWDGNFYAINASDGQILWKSFVGMAPEPENPGCFPSIGVTSQAAVAGGYVYVGGGDSALYVLDRVTGEPVRRIPLADPSQGSYLWSSVTVSGGALYIGVASLADCPLVRGALVRIDLLDPGLPVQIEYLAPEGEWGGGIWSTPAVDEEAGTVIATTGTGEQDEERGMWGGTLLAFDAVTLEKRSGHYYLPTNSIEDDIEWGSSPVLFTLEDGTRMVAASGKDGMLYALRREDLSLAWQTNVALGCICPECGCGSLSTPAFDGRLLYLGAGATQDNDLGEIGSIYAIEPATGRVIWRRILTGTIIAPVTVANRLVFASTLTGLNIFDAATGQTLFAEGDRNGLYSQPVVADGTIYCTYISGDVVAWRVP